MFNVLDMFGLATTFFLMLVIIFGISFIPWGILRILAALATCSNLLKIFDWLRLFQGTSFYILLIANTLRDIKEFFVIFLLSLITFGMPLHMLDLNRDEDNLLVDSSFGFWPLDLIYNQYLLSLGQFDSLEQLGEGASHEKMVRIFFVAATFMTQITMLNMLIAIMGDSFDYATENRPKFAIKTKLEILGAQAPALPQVTEEMKKDVYLIVVRPEEVEEVEEDAW